MTLGITQPTENDLVKGNTPGFPAVMFIVSWNVIMQSRMQMSQPWGSLQLHVSGVEGKSVKKSECRNTLSLKNTAENNLIQYRKF